ncbi:MAG: helix-turn-helix domain-containing protein [Mycoplasmatales bacterium]
MNKNDDNINTENLKENTYQELMQDLQQKRNQLNKSIEEIAKELLISSENIKKLEQGKSVGNNSYMRMILKKYITILGLNYEENKRVIKNEFPSLVEETIVLNELSPEKLKKATKKRSFKNIKKIISYLIFLLFIIFLIFITVYNFKNKPETNQTINETTKLQDTVLTPDKIIDNPVVQPKVEVEDNVIKVLVTDLKNINVKIHALGEVYLDYSIDDNIQEQKTLSTDEDLEYTLEDANNLEINIGNIQNIEVKINDTNITDEIKDLTGHYYIVFEKQES